MRLSAIAAISDNFVIGKDNTLPWYLPADLKHFKQITMGNPILMGRKTFESIGRALPGRQNIVITHDKTFQAPGCLVVNSIEEALQATSEQNEAFIIGGAQLYQQMLPHVQRLYLTIIHQTLSGNAFFPIIDQREWNQVECIDYIADTENRYSYSFIILDRKTK